jgi:hypothetical protein
MEKLKHDVIRFAIGMMAVVLVAGGIAMACPKGTHPVCHYDPNKGKSVCHCVASEQEACPSKAVE